MKDDTAGTLTVAAVPIGCPDDASPRLAAALSGARIIAAEDTRRLRRLAASLGVSLTATVVSYYDAVEQQNAISIRDFRREKPGPQMCAILSHDLDRTGIGNPRGQDRPLFRPCQLRIAGDVNGMSVDRRSIRRRRRSVG